MFEDEHGTFRYRREILQRKLQERFMLQRTIKCVDIENDWNLAKIAGSFLVRNHRTRLFMLFQLHLTRVHPDTRCYVLSSRDERFLRSNETR